MKSQVVTARISQDLFEKIKYLEINVTEVIRYSLNLAVVERETRVSDLLESKKMRIIGGLITPPNPMWEQIMKLSGEEKKLAVIHYIAESEKKAKREIDKLIREGKL